MASFGESLRRERELRGVTLAELAAATNIGLRYLTALENDQFDRLPGGVYNRGFVRAIARYLGLDEHEWVATFVHAAQEEPEVVARYALTPSAPKTPRPGWTSFVLLVILFGTGLFAVHSVRTRRAAEALAASGLPAQTTPRPAALPASTVPPPPVAVANVSTDKPAPLSSPAVPEAQTGEGVLHLQVFAMEDAWVSIAGDGRTLYEGMLKSRETRVFRADNQLDLHTGNASALVLTLNGETLAPLGNPGEVKRVTLSRKDLGPPPR